MKNLSILISIIVMCIICSLGLMGQYKIFHSTIPAAIAASDVRAVDELIGERVLIKFTTGAGYGHAHEKVRGIISKRRGQFLVVQAGRKEVWCNLQTISTIWLEEEK
ncbi:hypothetical protein ES703_27685 [subsurface metagenome]